LFKCLRVLGCRCLEIAGLEFAGWGFGVWGFAFGARCLRCSQLATLLQGARVLLQDARPGAHPLLDGGSGFKV
jgi:hypothetical protein